MVPLVDQGLDLAPLGREKRDLAAREEAVPEQAEEDSGNQESPIRASMSHFIRPVEDVALSALRRL
jgi:hypothetical protein